MVESKEEDRTGKERQHEEKSSENTHRQRAETFPNLV
jgi:hypothetical protein